MSSERPLAVRCADGKTFERDDCRCIGSVKRVRDRSIQDPPVLGEFPVFIEQTGNFRMFTYNKKSVEIIV